MSDVKLKTLVSKQVPEFVREDNPAFVAFLEAYYEFLDQNYNVDISSIRDLDKTLEEFVSHMKNEFNIFGEDNYEHIDKILLLRKVKQLLVAKGSEAAYKFLFKILYDKPVTISYPWDSVLKASDGKWKRDTTLFIQISQGDPLSIIGSRVSILGAARTMYVYVQNIRKVSTDTILNATALTVNVRYKIETVGDTDFTLIGATDNNVGTEFIATGVGTGTGTVLLVEDPVYEFFIEKSYYGEINVGDTLNFEGIIGTIIPTTVGYEVIVKGKGYAVGDLVIGTTYANNKLITQRLKVTKVDIDGGIQAIKTLTFGYGYTSEFFLYLSGKKAVSSTSRIELKKDVPPSPTLVTQFSLPDSSQIESYNDFGQVINPNYWVTSTNSITFTGNSTNVITGTDTINYTNHLFSTGDVVTYTNGGGTTIGGLTSGNNYYIIAVNANSFKLATTYSNAIAGTAIDITSTGSGSAQSIVSRPVSESAYAGTLLQQFFTETLNNEEITEDYALIKFNIGAVAKYQGYYSSNDGFLSDNIHLQDSKYYQKYSYLITIDERLESYKTLLKSFIHPAGIALFGEYQIQNNYATDLSVNIEVAEYISKATVVTINKSLSDSLTITGAGGRINKDGFDSQSYFIADYNIGTSASTFTG